MSREFLEEVLEEHRANLNAIDYIEDESFKYLYKNLVKNLVKVLEGETCG